MGWFGDAMGWLTDDVLGFDPSQANAPPPAAYPAVATTDPATNLPAMTPEQATYDRVRSYLQYQAQESYIKNLQEGTKAPVSAPPSFLQTEKGQKMVTFGIIGVIAWLFFKG